MNPKKSLLVLLFLNVLLSMQAADIVWFNGKTPITYSVESNAEPVVLSAIDMWKDDMRQVTGMIPEKASQSQAKICIKEDKKWPKKEAFRIEIIQNQLTVTGSDARGLAYGILELSRLAGVSPWIWWGDVVPDKKDILSLPADFRTEQSPSVEFRGIFLNDEDWSSLPWAQSNFDYELIDGVKMSDNKHWKGAIGPKAYEKFFQLLLRLRANTLLPAMHEVTVPFYLVKGNREMAEKYGIIVGTSHCEPLMCNAAGEWDVRGKGDYNYITNKAAVLNFWTMRLKEVNKGDNIFTMGMRGKHDGSMEGVKTLQEKTDALQQVIYEQRTLLKEYINRDLSKIPQQFVPYKEVLEILENGLVVPDDIMLTWCDDNYGYMTRLSDSLQQMRSGGAGVYYHASYWGRPHSYLWLTTTQPGLIYNEMLEAYQHNARRLWAVNVHDPKVAKYQLELFLDLAWQSPEKITSLNEHLKNTLIRDYGMKTASKIFPAVREFYRLTDIRKPEFMGWSQIELDKRKYPGGKSPVIDTEFSTSEFGDELDRYLNAYKQIKNTVSTAEKTIPKDKEAAYFSQIEYPIFGAAAMAEKCLYAQKARNSDDSLSAKTWRQASENAYNKIVTLSRYYNDSLSGGKWKKQMTYNPQDLPVFGKPDFEAEEKNITPQSKIAATDTFYVARNAVDFQSAPKDIRIVEMLGHSMKAIALPKGEELIYNFETKQAGDAVLRTACIPTQPNDKGDLRFSVQIDNETPQIVSLKEPFRSEQWKLNVLRGQAVKITRHTLSEGKHQLTIKALDNHIVVDQWMLDFDTDRKFYMFPVH